MTHRTHIAIIGGGPAGASVALRLARAGLRTAVIHRGGPRRAGYGETLPPAARTSLEGLGLWSEFAAAGHMPFFGNCSCWGSDILHEHDFLYQPHDAGWRIDRGAFDAMLAQAAREAGAEWFEPASIVEVEQRDSRGWRLTLANISIEAELVIDASGRASSFARSLGVERRSHDRLIGIGAVVDTAPAFSDTRTLVESSAEGWWYSGIVPGGGIAVVFFTDSDLAVARRAATIQGWRDLLKQTVHTSQRVADGAPALRTMAANSSTLVRCTGDRWLAVGDAAAAYDPLSSQGIFMALAASELAAHAAARFLSGDHHALEKYRRAVERAFANYLHNRRAFYGVERRWVDFEFWRRRSDCFHGPAAYSRTENEPEQPWISHP